jgi:DnaJ-class molecular chaperone
MSESKTIREATGITYEGVTYSLVKKQQQLDTVETCPVCGGNGQMYSRKCKECHGRGLIHESLTPPHAVPGRTARAEVVAAPSTGAQPASNGRRSAAV